tara:strand:- start:676 stop:1047 length:372 start_codon:yes stop_codon:yes gene_type:complete
MLSQRVEVLEKQMAALLVDNSTNTEDKPVKKVKKADKDDKPKKTKKADKDDKPKKKRVSGYLLFSKLTRDEVKQELFGDEKPKNSEIMVELGKRWKALDDEEREEWNRQAKEAASGESAEEEE